ncbi:hypothetical protein [Stenotrophomonas sp. SY1]|uniref:hypothetical protein n=1 Tax=Stenotrophomonas sp. SY1 TaxID=477235 RepID=UPI001E3A708E|nr:hypothetical protein [Stenotrophomonas sp. SY1]MCD9085810.1 hypothetical protein [Stenotrophomonas sp. SY1]
MGCDHVSLLALETCYPAWLDSNSGAKQQYQLIRHPSVGSLHQGNAPFGASAGSQPKKLPPMMAAAFYRLGSQTNSLKA